METQKRITVQNVIETTPEKVWSYYTEPEHIVRWNFAASDWLCPSAENDLRIGGIYKARMEAKDGSWGFDFEARYTSLDIGRSFTYVMPDGRVVDVTLNAKDNNSTELVVTFDPETQNPVEMQRGGWQAILDNFKTYAEQHA